MYFFQEFPKTRYAIDGQSVNMVDISVRVKLLDYVKKNQDSLVIINYEIENEKRPEEISFELYDTYDYTWTILLLNDVYSVYKDWVLSQINLDKFITKKYGSIEKENREIVAYYDANGYEVGKTSLGITKTLTAFDKIVKENEAKKTIRVFDPSIINVIQSDLPVIKNS